MLQNMEFNLNLLRRISNWQGHGLEIRDLHFCLLRGFSVPMVLTVYLALDIWFMPNATCSELANMVWVCRNKLEMKSGSPYSLSTHLPGWYKSLNFFSFFFVLEQWVMFSWIENLSS